MARVLASWVPGGPCNHADCHQQPGQGRLGVGELFTCTGPCKGHGELGSAMDWRGRTADWSCYRLDGPSRREDLSKEEAAAGPMGSPEPQGCWGETGVSASLLPSKGHRWKCPLPPRKGSSGHQAAGTWFLVTLRFPGRGTQRLSLISREVGSGYRAPIGPSGTAAGPCCPPGRGQR